MSGYAKCTEEAINMIRSNDDGDVSDVEFVGNIAIVRDRDGDTTSSFTCYDISGSQKVPETIIQRIKRSISRSSKSARDRFNSINWDNVLDKSVDVAREIGQRTMDVTKSAASATKNAVTGMIGGAATQIAKKKVASEIDNNIKNVRSATKPFERQLASLTEEEEEEDTYEYRDRFSDRWSS